MSSRRTAWCRSSRRGFAPASETSTSAWRDALPGAARRRNRSASPAQRLAYFCSGCPHNRSTVVPDGSIAAAGIGCHGMAVTMERTGAGFTQMGGEGAQWVGASYFSGTPHLFQNIGDGTLFHSGSLAIRQADRSRHQHHLQDPL